MSEITCVVVTPEETALEQTTSFVVVPLADGEKGVGPGHSPMIGRLGHGELRLGRGADASRYYVDGGFVQIADNVVTVLTARAIPATKIDVDVARESMRTAASRPADTDELRDHRDKMVS